MRAANVDDVPVGDHKVSAFGVVGTEGLLETFQSAWDRLQGKQAKRKRHYVVVWHARSNPNSSGRSNERVTEVANGVQA